jgi:hypothetical protein
MIARATEIAIERKDELRDWVIKHKSYGGAGAINGPVFRDREEGIRHCIFRRAFDIAREEHATR